jgi:hypothetical protein
MSSAARGAAPAEELVATVVSQLQGVATAERAEREKAYLRSELEFLGAAVPAIRQAATAVHRGHPALPHDALVGLVERFWTRGIHELRMVAVELLKLYADRLTPDDADLIEWG